MNFLSRGLSLINRSFLFIAAILFLLTANAKFTYSQATTITDSLNALLEDAAGIEKVDLLNELAHEMEHRDPDSSMILCRMAENLARSLDYRSGLAKAYRYKGNVYSITNRYDRAINAFDSAVIIYEQIDDQEGLLSTVNNIGNTYRIMGNYDDAHSNFIASLRIAEKIGSQKGIAYASLNIGLIYALDRDQDDIRGLPYFLSALEICQEIDDKRCIAYALNNISLVYMEMEEYDKALEYLHQSLDLKKSSNDQFGIASAYNNLGDVYTMRGEFHTSIDYNVQALEIYLDLNDSRGIVHSTLDIAKAYANLKEFEIGENYLKQAYTHSQSIESLYLKSATYLYMYQFYDIKEDYKEALKYHILYNQLQDSIYTEASSEQIAEMRTQYETEKIEAENILLTNERTIQDLRIRKSENLRTFFIIALILTLLIAGFAYYGYYQKQRANRFLEMRNRFEIENKKRAISLFGQQVSKEVALELLSDSFKSGSKKIFACIMFLDIRDFTPFVADKDPDEIIQYQNDVFGFMIDIISEHHGIINQFMGDGFMATFGAPASSGNDCQNAVNASIDIIDKLKEKVDSGNLEATKVGIGIHAGNIVTGNVGTAQRKQYSITGNTVILASRIEQLNKDYQSDILISREVFEKVELSGMQVKDLGKITIKGRMEPMEILKIG